jgi:quercetin dioxygenase-like cupin family protein
MEIMRAGSRPSLMAPAKYFTGTVRQDPIYEVTAPGRMRAVTVTFEPGARTNWHTHPFGQTLLIQSGLGRVQVWGQPMQDVRPGDVVWFPPGEKHWHGAAPTVAMSHIAMHEALDGESADWLEPVSDEQYGGK